MTNYIVEIHFFIFFLYPDSPEIEAEFTRAAIGIAAAHAANQSSCWWWLSDLFSVQINGQHFLLFAGNH